jgi:hypothetical protein
MFLYILTKKIDLNANNKVVRQKLNIENKQKVYTTIKEETL